VERLLTREETDELARRKTDEAYNELVRRNMGLVYWAVNRLYGRRPDDHADLVQEGAIALMKAVRVYDPDRPTKLSTCAMWWIKSALRRTVARIDSGRYNHTPRWGNKPEEKDMPRFNPIPIEDVLHLTDGSVPPDDVAVAREELRRVYDTTRGLVRAQGEDAATYARVAEARVLVVRKLRIPLKALSAEMGITQRRIREIEAEFWSAIKE
jgi:RNA polymerase sigma factor (sigma-70 family)